DQDPSSSQTAASCWGPRSRSGSSALNVVAIAPFGQVRRRFDDSYTGRHHGGATARMPLSPSTRTSRASAAVAATRAILLACPEAPCPHTHSANVRVFPTPRPANSSQICHQVPEGGSWFGRATAGQEFSSASTSSAAKELAIARRSFAPLIRERRCRSVRGIELAQCRNYGLSRFRIWGHSAHDPGGSLSNNRD